MANRLAGYSLEGNYSSAHGHGIHSGHVTHYDDGKVIGKISCTGQDLFAGPDRLVLGLMDPDQRRLDFLAIAPCLRNQYAIAPLLCTAKRVSAHEEFAGCWMDASDLPSIVGFERLMALTGALIEPDLLADYPIGQMRRTWELGELDSRDLADIISHGQRARVHLKGTD